MIEITFCVLLSQLGFLLPLAFFWVDSEDYPWKSGAKYGDTAGVHCVVHKVQEGITRLSSSPSRDLNIHRERSFFGNSLVPIIQWLLGFYRTSPRWCGIMPTLWNMSPKRISSINRGCRFKLCETKHLELLKLRKMEDILHQLIWRISHFLEAFINDRWLFGISEPSTVFLKLLHRPRNKQKSHDLTLKMQDTSSKSTGRPRHESSCLLQQPVSETPRWKTFDWIGEAGGEKCKQKCVRNQYLKGMVVWRNDETEGFLCLGSEAGNHMVWRCLAFPFNGWKITKKLVDVGFIWLHHQQTPTPPKKNQQFIPSLKLT